MPRNNKIRVAIPYILFISVLIACFALLGPFSSIGETASEQIVVDVEEDAHVQGGSDADDNFGDSTILRVHMPEDPEDAQEAYLKFRIPDDSRVLTEATVTLYERSADSSEEVVTEVLPVLDDTWQEDQITANNKPGLFGEVIASSVALGDQYINIDVTALAQQANADDKVFSLAIRSSTYVYRARETMYASKEGRSSERPKLTLTFSDDPPTEEPPTEEPPADEPPTDDPPNDGSDDDGSGSDGGGGSSTPDPELVCNGTFDTDLTCWNNISTENKGTASVENNKVRLESFDGSGYGTVDQMVPTIPGQAYRLSVDAVQGHVRWAALAVTNQQGGGSEDRLVLINFQAQGLGHYQRCFTAAEEQVWILLTSGEGIWYADNVSLQAVAEPCGDTDPSPAPQPTPDPNQPAVLDPTSNKEYVVAPGETFSAHIETQMPDGATWSCWRESYNPAEYTAAPAELTINSNTCNISWTTDSSHADNTYAAKLKVHYTAGNTVGDIYVPFFVNVTNNPPAPTPDPNGQVLGSIIGNSTSNYFVGDTINGTFQFTNGTDNPIVVPQIVIGGRFNGVDDCSNYPGGCPDFTKHYDVPFQPHETKDLPGTFTPALPGTYEFQGFYCLSACDTPQGDWHWNITQVVVVNIGIKPSTQGLVFLADLEGGFKEYAYNDLGDGNSLSKCTIGYGQVLFFRPCTEQEKQIKTTELEARKFLEDESQDNANKILELVQTPLNQQQFDALIAFMYNLGTDILTVGDPDRILLNYLNNRDLQQVPGEIKLYNKTGGQFNQGVQNRRCEEADLFEKGDYVVTYAYCPRAD